MKKFMIASGCGFIGSAVIRHLIKTTDHEIINIEKMIYAASEDPLDAALKDLRHILIRADITDADAMSARLSRRTRATR